MEASGTLLIKQRYFSDRLTIHDAAQMAGIAPETLNRIVNGKQTPGYGEGQSAERIARAVGWTGDVRELFAEVGEECDQEEEAMARGKVKVKAKCDYCEDGVPIVLDEISKVSVRRTVIDGHLVHLLSLHRSATDNFETSAIVNYCPMCGREFKGGRLKIG